jgi:hypothetical protein
MAARRSANDDDGGAGGGGGGGGGRDGHGDAAPVRKRVRFSDAAPMVRVFEREDAMATDAARPASGPFTRDADDYMGGMADDDDDDDDGEEEGDADGGGGLLLPVEYSDSEGSSDEGGDGGHEADEEEEDEEVDATGRPHHARHTRRALERLVRTGDERDAPLADEGGSDDDGDDGGLVDWAALGPDGLLSRADMAAKRAHVRVPPLPDHAAMGAWLQRSLGQEDLSLAAVTASAAAGTLHGHDPSLFARRADAISARLDAVAPPRGTLTVPAPPPLTTTTTTTAAAAVPSPKVEKGGPHLPPRRVPTPVPGYVREPDKWTRYTLEEDRPAEANTTAAATAAAALAFLAELRARRAADPAQEAHVAAVGLALPAPPGSNHLLQSTAAQVPGQLRVLPPVEVGMRRTAERGPAAGVGAGVGAAASVALSHLGHDDDDGDEDATLPEPATPTAAGTGAAGTPLLHFRRAVHRPSRLRVSVSATDSSPLDEDDA